MLLSEKEKGKAMSVKSRGRFISHLKKDLGIFRNYLSSTTDGRINKLIVASVHYMKKWMRLKKEEIRNLFFLAYYT
ncbi:MAG: hypothetical protein NTY95_18720 [Bacteroidia bacterium]|nr:hypothetical protein [Bacteroidia bacterium]